MNNGNITLPLYRQVTAIYCRCISLALCPEAVVTHVSSEKQEKSDRAVFPIFNFNHFSQHRLDELKGKKIQNIH